MSDNDTKPTTKPDAPAPKKPVAKAKGGDGRTVDEWAKLKFPVLTLKHSEQNNADAWKHSAAAGLHCWPEHKFHANGAMVLSEGDYDAAIKAACTPNERGSYTPHKAALSPHNKVGLTNLKP